MRYTVELIIYHDDDDNMIDIESWKFATVLEAQIVFRSILDHVERLEDERCDTRTT